MRLILILALVGYLLYKLGLFRGMVRANYNGRGGRPGNGSYNQHNRRRDSNVNIDSVPKDKKEPHYKGGEYIDYEEVD